MNTGVDGSLILSADFNSRFSLPNAKIVTNCSPLKETAIKEDNMIYLDKMELN